MAIDRAKGRGPIPAGSNQQIQYNNNGVLGASSNMTFDGSRLDVTGEMRASIGILFGTDTAAENTLDDYEEGTWTPTPSDSGGTSFGINYQNGRYVKIGKLVWCLCELGANHNNSSPGNFTITGLPFTQEGTVYGRSHTTWANIGINGGSTLSFYSSPSQTYLTPLISYDNINTGWSTSYGTGNFRAAGFELNFSILYRVA